MKLIALGAQGLEVTPLGLGCMSMSEFYGTADEAEVLRTIHRAVDLGVTLFDTANVYGPYKNEQLVGKALKDRREQVVIASKFGIDRAQDGSFLGINGSPSYARSCCEASLTRLGVDVIDLYYLHRVDPKIPIEDTVGAMADLVHSGKVRYLGLSEALASTLKRAHAVHPISALQTEYSLWSRQPELELFPTLSSLGVGFVAYSPLGRGFLTGTLTKPSDLLEGDWRRTAPRFQGENFTHNLRIVDELKKIATMKSVTVGQLALAWLWSRFPNLVTIPGTTRTRHLEENVAANGLSLSQSDLDAIEALVPPGIVQGERYPEGAMSTLNH